MILLYHRVSRPATDPQLLAVSPANFAAHLEVLGRTMRPLPLAEMVAAAVAGRLPERAVAVTFDDGYADNLLQAEPLLRRYGIPATVFATTGRTDTLEEYFWDELDRLLLQPGGLPRTLAVTLAGTVRTFDLGRCVEYSEADWLAGREWNALGPAAAGSRQQVYADLCAAMVRATADERAAALAAVRLWAGATAVGRPSHRMMTSAELRRLDGGGLVRIGGHTVEHPVLAVETPARQSAEVTANKRAIEAMLGRPLTEFAYPFGCRGDYSAESIAAVRGAGYTVACSNFRGQLGRGETDPLQVPRFVVRNWTADRFAAEIAARADRR